MTVYEDFTLGIATQAPRLAASVSGPLAGMRGAKTAVNVTLDERGVRTATGYTRILEEELPGPVTGMAYYRRYTGTIADELVLVAGGQFFSAIDAGYVPQGSGLDLAARMCMLVFNGYTLYMNGVDDVGQYDGTTAGDVTFEDDDVAPILPTPFRPTFAWIHRGNIYYGGDAGTPYRIYKPAPGTHNRFDQDGAEAFDVSLGDGEPVVGAVSLTKGISIIFKTGSTHVLSGANTFDSSIDPLQLVEFSREIGCLSRDSIVPVGPEVFFMASNGSYKKLSYVSVSGNIKLPKSDPLYYAQPYLDNFDQSKAEMVNAAFNANERLIYLTFPTKQNTLTTLCYNVVTGGITERTGFSTTHQVYDKDTGTHYFSRDETEDVRVYKLANVPTYDGVYFTSEWETLYQSTGSMKDRKVFEKFLAYCQVLYGSAVKIGVRIVEPDGTITNVPLDFGITSAVDGWDVGLWDVALWDATLGPVLQQDRVGRGVAFSVYFKANIGGAFWVDRIELDSVSRGPGRR